MKRQPAFYTFRVWFTSAALSPIIAAILQFYICDAQPDKLDWLEMYPLILLLELLVTGLLWVLFWALTAICSNLIRDDHALRCASSMIGLSIAGAVCWFYSAFDQAMLHSIFFDIGLANCTCIFAGCWYFDVSKPFFNSNPPTINTESHEQTTE